MESQPKKIKKDEIKHVLPKDVRMLLSKSKDPAETIRQFQKDNALKIGDSEVAVQFLDILGVERSQICRTLLDDLKTHLKGLVVNLEEAKVQELLGACFQFIKDEDLGEIGRLCLERVSTLPPSVCNAVVRSHDMSLLQELPLKLQRRVMEQDIEERAKKRRRVEGGSLSFLEQQISPAIEIYLYNPLVRDAADEIGVLMKFPTQVRRNKLSNSLDKLSSVLGKPLSVSFLAATIHYLARIYYLGANSKNTSSCAATLLADLLITVHPTQDLADASLPIAKALRHLETLAKILDSCVRECKIDEKKIEEIHGVICKALRLKKEDAAGSSIVCEALANSEIDPDELKRCLQRACKKFEKKDKRKVFLHPVDDEQAPGYSNIIKNPICLNQIKDKVELSVYSNMAQFNADLMLMLDNCLTYNNSSSEYYKLGMELKKNFVPNMLNKIAPAPPPPARESQSKEGPKQPLSPLPSTPLMLSKPIGGAASVSTSTSQGGGEVRLLVKGIVMLLADPFVSKIMTHQASSTVAQAAKSGNYDSVQNDRILPLILQLMEISNMPLHDLDSESQVVFPACDPKMLHEYLPGIAKFSHDVLDKPPPPDTPEADEQLTIELKKEIKMNWSKPFQTSALLCKIIQIMLCTQLRKASCHKVSILLLLTSVALRKRKEFFFYRPFWFSVASAVISCKKEKKLSCELFQLIQRFCHAFLIKSAVDSSIHEQCIRLLGDMKKLLEEDKKDEENGKKVDSNTAALSALIEDRAETIVGYWEDAVAKEETKQSVHEILEDEKMKKIKEVYHKKFFKFFPQVKEKLHV